MKRREFISSTVAVAAGAVLATQISTRAQSTWPNIAEKHSVRIGGPVFFSDQDPEKWAIEARKKYRAVYAPNVSLDDKDRIKAVIEAVKKNDLVIAEVGAWCNMLDVDPDKRKANLDNVINKLAIADEIGARCCVNIAGSFNPDHWDGPHPKDLTDEFFDQTVENARKIIDAVNPKRSKFALEMMAWAYPYSADSYLRLIKAIDRKGFGVHIDICNMINSPAIMWNTTGLINETFDKLGQWIASCHAKDLKWIRGAAVHFEECALGDGNIDYATYLGRLATLPDKDVPLMMEHMPNEEVYEKCRQHLIKVAAANDIDLG